MSTPVPIHSGWGVPPWTIDFRSRRSAPPPYADIVIIGGGFSGLSAAAWLRKIDPSKSVAVLEAGTIGAGASGRTGGMVLSETAAGDLPGLGDVLAGFSHAASELQIDCALSITGAWEIERSAPKADERARTRGKSPIEWQDSGTLRVTKDIPGGTIDPGMLMSGLARAAENLGAVICEHTPAGAPVWGSHEITIPAGATELRCGHVLYATNALELQLSGLANLAEPAFTLALATGPLRDEQLEAIGLAGRQPFYTNDFPYLWGRVTRDNSVVWGGGLIRLDDWSKFYEVDVASGEAARILASLESRVRKLHPVLQGVEITHRWGGPILFAESMKPAFHRHPQSQRGVVMGAYSGHGVALSVHLGVWAAGVLLGRRRLPRW